MNPARFVANQTALNAMCDAVFTLGAASFLLDNAGLRQARRPLIHTWFLNPKTRMNPDLDYAQSVPGVNNGRGAGVVDGRVFVRAIQGMEFLAQTGDWDAKDQAAVHKWFEEYLHWLTHQQERHRREEERQQSRFVVGRPGGRRGQFRGNKPRRSNGLQFYRDHLLPRQIMPDGSAPREEMRARSLRLSSFNSGGVLHDLPHRPGARRWTVERARAQRRQHHRRARLPLALPRRSQEVEQGTNFDIPNDSLNFLAFAGMGLKKPEYIADFRKLERPDDAWISLVDLLVGRFEAAAHQTRH